MSFTIRLVRTIAGFTLLIIGIIMIVTPGPAFILIPSGLALLASEFPWAKKIFRRGQAYIVLFRRKKKRQKL